MIAFKSLFNVMFVISYDFVFVLWWGWALLFYFLFYEFYLLLLHYSLLSYYHCYMRCAPLSFLGYYAVCAQLHTWTTVNSVLVILCYLSYWLINWRNQSYFNGFEIRFIECFIIIVILYCYYHLLILLRDNYFFIYCFLFLF